MGTSATTSTVYIHVIEDVINKVRDEFLNNGGPGESILHELQGIWEMKMMQAGAILGPIDRSGAPKTGPGGGPVHDLNVPYDGTEEYETPTAEMLFPPTPMQTPLPTPLPGSMQTPLPGNVQTPLPGSVDSSMYNIPTGSSTDYPTPISDIGGASEAKAGRPSPFMPPPSAWMNQNPPLSVDVNVAYVEGRDEVDRGASRQPLTQDFFTVSSGKRKREEFAPQYNNGGFIPQQDGAGEAAPEVMQRSAIQQLNARSAITNASQGTNKLRCDKSTTVNVESIVHAARSSFKIPQQDGPIPDPYDDMLSTPNIYNYQGVVNEDYNITSTPAPTDLQENTPAVVLSQNDIADEDDDEEALNEDDDDEDDLDDVDEGEELNTQHLVLAQFDKVTRAKNKWKCTLKDGIMHINNKDVLFNKATGEFEF